ncbi:MAG: recombinase family protein [Candidatus Omnitrophica bacterium]|nr:recombinase family protein [Candidatus Omnitrophota bacterium]
MNNKPLRAVCYARVSKNDESQDPLNQLKPLRDYANALQAEIVGEYVDLASGGGSVDRVNFLRMLDDADKGKFDLVLIWALDRLSREGISNTLGYLDRLKRNGVALKSLRESWLDTRDESLGQLLIAIFSWIAAQERQRIRERTLAGLERAKRQGKQLGRPKGSKDSKARRKSGYYVRWTK